MCVGAGHWPPGNGRLIAAPMVPKKLFGDWVGEALGPPAGICTGSVGSVKPGAPTGPHQPKFLQTQGPVARLEFRHSLRFCAPEILCQAKGITPVNGVRGKRPMDLGGTKWSRSPSAASPVAFCPIPRYSRRSPAKRVRREEEEQGNERSFRRQAETEWSGLKVNWPEGTREGGLGHCDDEPPWAK